MHPKPIPALQAVSQAEGQGNKFGLNLHGLTCQDLCSQLVQGSGPRGEVLRISLWFLLCCV